ncbi:MAG: HlyD family efflux transporter periplasmic adaptor subunit, partial [Thermoguttaceae bacterium]|nr:HlyD family efflux transporter periplasmic adaptor subunit [Thermoguttaceae bacterium]
RADTGPKVQQGYLRFLLEMCELAADFLKSHQLRHFSDRQALWTKLEDFTRAVYASLDPRATAYTIANEGRRLIECDRLSVALRRGNRCRIEAISGQDLFDKRSNVVRLLGDLATAVVRTGEPVWYTGDTTNMAPQVEEAVQAYVDEAHSKTVAVLPLARPAPDEEDDPTQRDDPEAPVGAIIVEQIEDSRVLPTLVQRVEVVGRHSAAALANADQYNSLFLMPVWRTLGKARWIVRARTLPKTLAITAAVVLALAMLCLWPAKFEMSSRGTLEPVIRYDVFARADGVIDAVHVEHGDVVRERQELVLLRNKDLQVARTDVLGQRNTVQQRIRSIHHLLRESRSLTVEEQSRLSGELAELDHRLRTLEDQIALLNEKLSDLTARSPIDGQVVTWELENRLIRRPVQRGQVLLRVADPAGPWQLELRLPEDRVGHIVRAQHQRYEELRRQLRAAMREQSAEAADEQVDARLEAVPDDQLAPQLRELRGPELLGKLQDGLRRVLRIREPREVQPDDNAEVEGEEAAAQPDMPEHPPEVESGPPEPGIELEPALWSALEDVLKATSYPAAREQLAGIVGSFVQSPLRPSLKALLDDGLDPRLPVEFVLATDPGDRREGRVAEIDLSAEVRGEDGNTVLVKVEIDKEELPHLRPGASVSAKVHCGRAAIGYVYLHPVFEFIQSEILFRFF